MCLRSVWETSAEVRTREAHCLGCPRMVCHCRYSELLFGLCLCSKGDPGGFACPCDPGLLRARLFE